MKDEVIIIDVRSPEEFALGHYKHAINIPLEKLEDKSTLLNQNKKIITVCKSGVRGEFGKNILLNLGFNASNGGSWSNLKL